MSNVTVFEALDCHVSATSTRITCRTAPGVGNELVWKVVIDEQESQPHEALTNYHPPVITLYEGRGAENARTEGEQVVHIHGKHFGPAGTPVQRALYTRQELFVDDVRMQEHARRILRNRELELDESIPIFEATECELVQAHTTVQCITMEGAGTNLKWFLLIGNQLSESPSTNYAPPTVTSVSGPGAADASTEGGDMVVLRGTNFGPHSTGGEDFLDLVTYGPTSAEYVAESCEVLNHTAIQCTTAPGVGRVNRWAVTVEQQQSSLATGPISSYAQPSVTSVTLPREGARTSGGGTVRVVARNVGFAARANVSLMVNSRGYPVPAEAS